MVILDWEGIYMHEHGGNIAKYENVIDFSTNVNLAGMPESVRNAAMKGCIDAEQYPEPYSRSLEGEIAEAEGLKEEHIICGNGAAELIFLVTETLKPRKALLCVPTFAEYEEALNAVDCHVAHYVCHAEHDFIIQNDLLDYISEDLDLIFLCNPNNPTGCLIPEKLLRKVVTICRDKKVFLVIDECFLDFTEEGQAISLKSELKQNDRIVIIKAFTKTFAMPGLRLGYALSYNTCLIESIRKRMQPWSISLPAQYAGKAALMEKRYLSESLLILKKERSYLMDQFKNLGYRVYGSEANFIFFDTGDETLFERCLDKGFLIRDCSNFIGLKKGYYRIQVRNRQDNDALLIILRER